MTIHGSVGFLKDVEQKIYVRQPLDPYAAFFVRSSGKTLPGPRNSEERYQVSAGTVSAYPHALLTPYCSHLIKGKRSLCASTDSVKAWRVNVRDKVVEET